MAFFNRKQEEEYEDEDELIIDEEKDNRKFTRKLKDLNSENKKKRIEPPKPWGKKERLLVLIFMAGTILVSGILYLMSHSDLESPNIDFQSIKNFQLPRLNFSFPNIFKEETIEIYKK